MCNIQKKKKPYCLIILPYSIICYYKFLFYLFVILSILSENNNNNDNNKNQIKLELIQESRLNW